MKRMLMLYLNLMKKLYTYYKVRSWKTAKTKFTHQQPLIVIWDDVSGRNWHFGFYLDESDDGLVRIDHLERLSKNDDVHWKRPRSNDAQHVLLIQILSCKETSLC